MDWNYIVVASCSVLLFFLVWIEFRRQNKLRLIWRLAASVAAVIALACIAIPIKVQRPMEDTGNAAILLTDGFETDTLNSYKNLRIFTADNQIAKGHSSLRPSYIAGLDLFASEHADINTLHVFGYGLSGDELAQLKKFQLVFHNSKMPGGISSAHWPAKIKLGDKLVLQARYNSLSSRSTKLVLRGFGYNLDSAIAKANTDQAFELKTSPKHLGRIVYQLLAISGRDTVEAEELPVEVEPREPLRILLLASSPNFESKFLKDWLYEQKYSLASRTTISKDKSSTEFLNTSTIPLKSINSHILQNFDLLLTDGAQMSAFKTAEIAAIKTELGRGLGLIITADSSSKKFPFSNLFPTNHTASKSLSVNLTDNVEAAIAVENAIFIRHASGNQALIKDKKGNVLVSSRLNGGGKIVLNAVGNTYIWALAGKKNEYESFWSLLIAKAARTKLVDEQVTFSPFPMLNSATGVFVESSGEPPTITVTGRHILPIQNTALPFQWSGKFWPHQAGWNNIKLSSGKEFWQYIYPKGSWKTIKNFNKLALTRKYVESKKLNVPQKHNYINQSVPVSKSYFFFIFLAACVYLWFESKKS